jgi:drug/metabolite transporter (DMT)-like permease
MENKHLKDEVLVGAMVVSMGLWGLSWPSGKVLMHYCTPVNMAAYRYVVVLATLYPILLMMKVSLRVKKAGIPAIIASGALLAAYSVFMFIGLKRGTAGAGGVLVTTLNPIMAYTLGILLSRKLPSLNAAIGLLLGIAAGCVLLEVWSKAGAVFESGNLYFLLSALTWSVMSKITARGANYGSSMGFSLWQYVVTLLCLLPMVNWNEVNATIQVREFAFWGNLFFSAAIVTSLATTIYFYTTTRLGAEKASSFIFMVPLAAALSSWLLLGEHIQPHTAIGGVLGIAAVYAINRNVRARAQTDS